MDDYVFHKTCPHCSNYLGVLDELNPSEDVCLNCDKNIDMSNPLSSDIFVLIDPSKAIAAYLYTYDNHYNYVVKDRIHNKKEIRDIYDGKCYRDFVKKPTNFGKT